MKLPTLETKSYEFQQQWDKCHEELMEVAIAQKDYQKADLLKDGEEFNKLVLEVVDLLQASKTLLDMFKLSNETLEELFELHNYKLECRDAEGKIKLIGKWTITKD